MFKALLLYLDYSEWSKPRLVRRISELENVSDHNHNLTCHGAEDAEPLACAHGTLSALCVLPHTCKLMSVPCAPSPFLLFLYLLHVDAHFRINSHLIFSHGLNK